MRRFQAAATILIPAKSRRLLRRFSVMSFIIFLCSICHYLAIGRGDLQHCVQLRPLLKLLDPSCFYFRRVEVDRYSLLLARSNQAPIEARTLYTVMTMSSAVEKTQLY